MFGIGPIVLSLAFSIGLCVHVVRTGREAFWLWVILLFQPLGGIVYLVAIVLPSLMGGPTARRAGAAARATLDPTRDYRQAQQAVQDTPTVHNRMRLAEAAGELGRWDEALTQYRQAAQGVHAEDPALMEGLARALVELGQFAEALPILERLGLDGEPGHTPQIGLLFARAYEGLGRPSDADRYYRSAGLRTPGLEGLARYAAFLARAGRADEARQMLTDIDQRLARTNARFQKEGRQWRDLAAEAIARAR
ncbi:MAG TPA: tetratricopeptide repeat protein [Caulobacteraceae bacterium]|nr:tetratricopeptide repeat protein [Caulobacteraceae bacterium]